MKILAIFLSLWTTLCFAESQISGSPSEVAEYLNRIEIVGSARANLESDYASIRVNINTEDKYLRSALIANQRLRNDFITGLKEAGINEGDISTSRFSSKPQYGFFGKNAKSYNIDSKVDVRVSTEEEFQFVAGRIDSLDEMSYLGVTFEQNHKEHLLDSLLYAAYDNALIKAKELEGKLGISLKISSFKEIVDEKNEIWDGELNKSMRQEMQKLSFSTYEPSARFDEIELSKKVVVYFTISK